MTDERDSIDPTKYGTDGPIPWGIWAIWLLFAAWAVYQAIAYALPDFLAWRRALGS